MARKARIQYYGAIYYLMQQGRNGEKVFIYDQDKSYLLELISEAKEEKDFRIFAYAVMDNCYHLLIQTLNVPLSSIMHYINFKYARYYNEKNNRTGPVFQQRYKAILLQDERYILPIMKYIHRCPLLAGLCKTVEEYKWTSDVFYRVNMENMVNIEQVLAIFSPNRLESIERYIEYMDGGEDGDCSWVHSSIVGTEDFIRRMEGKETRKSLDELLRASCPTEVEFKLIKDGSRDRYLTQYKIKYILKGKSLGYTYKEIGENIGITGAAARSLAKKQI